jgi:hypothetical protein
MMQKIVNVVQARCICHLAHCGFQIRQPLDNSVFPVDVTLKEHLQALVDRTGESSSLAT